jgi:hypothetical protein
MRSVSRVLKLDVAWVGAGSRRALTACEDTHAADHADWASARLHC